jgi:hypothetical protein
MSPRDNGLVSASDADGQSASETDAARSLPAAVARLLDATGFTEEPATSVREQLHALNQSRRDFLTGLPQELPGLDVVLAAVPTDMPAVAVAGFLDTPHPELLMAHRPHTPVQWLQKGGDVTEVLRLLEIADWATR